MKIVDFSNHEFKKIPELQLPRQVTNTEARLYLYQDKTKWNKHQNILKIFYDNRSFDFKPYIKEELLQSYKKHILTIANKKDNDAFVKFLNYIVYSIFACF